MPLRMYKYRLYPNKATAHKLQWTLDRCRELYNAALVERRDAYHFHVKQHPNFHDEETRKKLSRELQVNYYQQKRDLTIIKHELREEYKDVASHVLQDVVLRLDKAFDAFFRRCANGEKPGYPRFKTRKRYDSFTYPDGAGWKLDGTRLHLSKIGIAKIRKHRELQGKIKTVTIKREVDQWFVCFSCEIDASEPLPVSYEDVGVDLGVTHLATLSNGDMIEHPRYYRKAEKKLARRQQAVSRKKSGSHRRKRAGKLVGKAHRKIARQRRDFLHKESRKLVKRYQVLVFEDLQIGNLTKAPKPKQDENGKYLPNGAAAKGGLNKSILDAGWGMFMSLCASKAEGAGRTLLKVNPQYTSQTCSVCGTVRKKTLEERWHACACGADMDRDVNAAINILALGLKHLSVGTRPTRATA